MSEDIQLKETSFGEYLCPSCNEPLECMGGMAHECTNDTCGQEGVFMADPLEDISLN